MSKLQETRLEQEETMKDFDVIMLEIHEAASKKAYEDAEKELIKEKNFKALEKLQQLRREE